MGFPEVRIQLDRSKCGRPRGAFLLRKPPGLEEPRCQRKAGMRRGVVGLKPDGSLKVPDRLPCVSFIVFELMVASEQERLAGLRVDAAGARQSTGFLGGEVRLNLLGDGPRDLGLE